MENNFGETFGAVVAITTNIVLHTFNVKLIDANVLHTGLDLGNKIINMVLSVATACVAYFAVYLIKKHITKEIK